MRLVEVGESPVFDKLRLALHNHPRAENVSYITLTPTEYELLKLEWFVMEYKRKPFKDEKIHDLTFLWAGREIPVVREARDEKNEGGTS